MCYQSKGNAQKRLSTRSKHNHYTFHFIHRPVDIVNYNAFNNSVWSLLRVSLFIHCWLVRMCQILMIVLIIVWVTFNDECLVFRVRSSASNTNLWPPLSSGVNNAHSLVPNLLVRWLSHYGGHISKKVTLCIHAGHVNVAFYFGISKPFYRISDNYNL